MSVTFKEIINPKSNKPKYQQLKSYLLTQMGNGRYKPGEVIPSENLLAKRLKIAPSTVRQALGELEKDGLVTRIRGKGTFVKKEENNTKIIEKIEAYAVIIPLIRGNSYPLIVNGIEHKANEHNYGLLVCSSHNSIDTQANIVLQLIYKNVAGVALVTPTVGTTPPYHVKILQDNDIPVVLHQRKIEGISAPVIGWRAEDVCKTAAEALVENGHRKIAYSGIYRYSLTEAYERNLRTTLDGYGIELLKNKVFYGPDYSDSNNEEFRDKHLNQVLENRKEFTVVFCSGYSEAESLYLKAIEKNIKVPEELSIVSVGEKDPRGALLKRMSAVVVDEFGIGCRSGKILHEMKTGERPINDDEDVVFPVEFRFGKTLSKVSG